MNISKVLIQYVDSGAADYTKGITVLQFSVKEQCKNFAQPHIRPAGFKRFWVEKLSKAS